MEPIRPSKLLVWLLVILIVCTGIFFGLKKSGLILKDTAKTISTEPVGVEIDTINIANFSASNVYPKCAAEMAELAFNNDLFEPLATFNPDNRLVPVLATKWDNPDDLTWRFYISPKAKFSNGEQVKAEDVKFTYDYIQSNQDLQINATLPTVDKITIIDDTTIEFTTKSPDPLLLNRLSYLLIMSKKDVELNGLNNKNIGSGPYIFVEKTDKNTKLVRNENYWREKPKAKNINYKLIDGDAKISSLLSGEVDIINYFSTVNDSTKLEQAVADGSFKIKNVAGSNVNYIDLDTMTAKTPYIDTPVNPLKDKRVRQAIMLAINIDDFTKNVPDTVASSQLVSPAIFGYNPKIVRPKYDLEKARALMVEAGYPSGFSMTIDYTEAPTAKEIYSRLVTYLANIGIKVTLNGLSQDVFFPKIMARDSSAYVIGFTPDTKDASEALEGLIHTPGQTYGQYNLGYSNPDLDKVIEEASSTLNQQIRQQKLQEGMKTAMDDYAKIPLFQATINYVYSSKIVWRTRLDTMLRASELAGSAK